MELIVRKFRQVKGGIPSDHVDTIHTGFGLGGWQGGKENVLKTIYERHGPGRYTIQPNVDGVFQDAIFRGVLKEEPRRVVAIEDNGEQFEVKRR